MTLLLSDLTPEDARPACEGLWSLFEAVDVDSHRQAKEICRTCDLFAKCAVLATTVEAPVGTWAGRLHGGNGRSSIDPEAENAMFTDDEAREANNAWQRGERTELNKIGRRVYKRRLDAAAKEREAGLLPNATAQRYAEEDEMFTDDEARRGASAYRGGDKSEYNALAQRVHMRRTRQARKAQREEGAA